MHILYYAVAALFLVIGLIEALPGLMQWGAWILQLPIAIFVSFVGGRGFQSMTEISKGMGFESPAFFYRYHGMVAAYGFLVFLSLAALLVWFGSRTKAEQERKKEVSRMEREREASEKARAAEHEAGRKAELQRRRSQMALIVSRSATLALEIPKHTQRAQEAVLIAEKEFSEGYLDPFWDAVENAVTELARVDSGIRQIAANLEILRTGSEIDNSGSIKVNVRAIATSLASLPTGAATYVRLQECIRKAQRSPDFTTIFHLRKTNRILVDGFSTLGQALFDMSSRLEDAVRGVGEAVMQMQSANVEIGNLIATELSDLQGIASQSNSDRGEAETKIIDILDNIQRGRRPQGPDWKPGTVRR